MEGFGTPITHSEYKPFGEPWVDGEFMEYGCVSEDPNTFPHQYAGTEWDGETGLFQLGARYYDPRLATFTQINPMVCGNAQMGKEGARGFRMDVWNPYSYSAWTPVVASDPTGLDLKLKTIHVANTGNSALDWIATMAQAILLAEALAPLNINQNDLTTDYSTDEVGKTALYIGYNYSGDSNYESNYSKMLSEMVNSDNNYLVSFQNGFF